MTSTHGVHEQTIITINIKLAKQSIILIMIEFTPGVVMSALDLTSRNLVSAPVSAPGVTNLRVFLIPSEIGGNQCGIQGAWADNWFGGYFKIAN